MQLYELLEVMSDRNEVNVYCRNRRDNLVKVACYDGKNSIDLKYNYRDVVSLAVDYDEGKICIDVIIDYLENRRECVRFKLGAIEEVFDFEFYYDETEEEITEWINKSFDRWVEEKLDELRDSAVSETIESDVYAV